MGGINPDGGYGKITGLVLAAVALQLLQTTLSSVRRESPFFCKDFLWVFTNCSQLCLRILESISYFFGA